MDREQNCFFCGRTDRAGELIAWFLKSERRYTHVECWITAHRPGPRIAA
jgi:hypothetical protein